jgi:hypothetical protein
MLLSITFVSWLYLTGTEGLAVDFVFFLPVSDELSPG